MVLFGVEDDGSVAGCEVSDAQRTQITKARHDPNPVVQPQLEAV